MLRVVPSTLPAGEAATTVHFDVTVYWKLA